MTRFITVLIGKVGRLYGIPPVKVKVPGTDWICPAQNELKWIPLVGTVKERQVPKKIEKF